MKINLWPLGRLHVHRGATVDRHVAAIVDALEAHEEKLATFGSVSAINTGKALHGALGAAANAMGVTVRPLSGGLIKPPRAE